MEHAPEPWAIIGRNPYPEELDEIGIGANAPGDRIYAVAVVLPAGVEGDENPELTEANARRIVACVNACKGLPTKDLEQTWGDGGLFEFIATSDHDALREEDRADALAARLEEAEGLLGRLLEIWDPEWEPGKSLHAEVCTFLTKEQP